MQILQPIGSKLFFSKAHEYTEANKHYSYIYGPNSYIFESFYIIVEHHLSRHRLFYLIVFLERLSNLIDEVVQNGRLPTTNPLRRVYQVQVATRLVPHVFVVGSLLPTHTIILIV